MRPRRRQSAPVASTDLEELVVVASPNEKGSNTERSSTYALDVVDIGEDEFSDDSAASSPTQRVRRTTMRNLAKQARMTPPSSPTRKAPDSPTTPLAPSPFRKENIKADSANPTPTATQQTRSRSNDEPAVERDPSLECDPSLEWYAHAYTEAQLRTFHCEKVKKIPLSGLDPSMLLGFLCRDEAEFEDFCDRVSKVRVSRSNRTS